MRTEHSWSTKMSLSSGSLQARRVAALFKVKTKDGL